MSATCCPAPPPAADPRYRRILWIALVANAAMFFVELAASAFSGSSALAADAADFAGDAANYGLSLAAIAAGGAWASRTALFKGFAMAVYGLGVIAWTAWRAWLGVPPEPLTMGLVGTLALVVNVWVAVLLYRYRGGDANMRSVWLCSRNDAIANVAVIAAALGVAGSGSLWPDAIVAAIIAGLALSSARSVIGQARRELAGTPVSAL